jgi:hypothetical protein
MEDDDQRKTYLVHIVVEACRMGDSFRDLVGKLHLFPYGIHGSVDFVDVPIRRSHKEKNQR